MNAKTIAKLRKEIEDLRARRSDFKQGELESLAKRLGRTRRKSGNEPQWMSKLLPNARPISIPGHKTIKRFTGRSILGQLEQDLDSLEAQSGFEREDME